MKAKWLAGKEKKKGKERGKILFFSLLLPLFFSSSLPFSHDESSTVVSSREGERREWKWQWKRYVSFLHGKAFLQEKVHDNRRSFFNFLFPLSFIC